MLNKIKILMLGKPGGTLARTYAWHIEALNSDAENRFQVDCIHEKQNNINIKDYDIFWFYAKAFQPSVYDQIKILRPDSKVICGPNILLDKPDMGISDSWDKWYVEKCRPDVHLDQVTFYSDHVKKFLSHETKKVARTLDKCMKIEDTFYKSDSEKVYDCLIYSKKRRYDHNFETFRNELINLLEEHNIKHIEIKAGKYGSYERSQYFDALNKSKITVNLSLDECPGILNYESMFFNVPVVGSPNNTPIANSNKFYVYDTDFMTEKYLVRKKDAAKLYFEKIVSVLNNDLKDMDHRKFILEHTSFSKYCDNVSNIIEECYT